MGRSSFEIPRPLDYLVVVDVLLFIFNIGMTLLRSPRRTTTSLILFFGLFSAALLYLPGMIDTTNQTMDSYWRWWVAPVGGRRLGTHHGRDPVVFAD